MTREEIMAMEAGRELDELIEQCLFRLVRGHRKDGSRCWKDNKGNPVRSDAKPYSTDISVAWQVKEKLNGEGLLLTLTDFCPSGGELCGAEFWDNMGLVPSKIVGKAETEFAPEAICKAALLAKLEVK